MKRTIYLVMLAVITFQAKAQPAKVTSAFNYLNYFTRDDDKTALPKAKEAIDLAVAHEATMGEAKTWFYRGNIYMTGFEYNLKSELDKLGKPSKDPKEVSKRTFAAYQNTPSNDLDVAYESYKKAKELDVKKGYEDDIRRNIDKIARHYENKGIALYNIQKYGDAVAMFEKAHNANLILGLNDTANIENIAITADKAGDYDKAITYYNKQIALKTGNATPYFSLAKIYTIKKDSVAVMDIVKKGRAAYPEDVTLVSLETDYLISHNRIPEAIENLKLIVSKKPDYPHAVANLGILYYNIAANLNNELINIPIEQEAKYNQKIAARNEQFKLAVPHLEQSVALFEKANLKDDTYFNTLVTLVQIFNFLEQEDKAAACQVKVEALQKK